jgi:hypothetical protein
MFAKSDPATVHRILTEVGFDEVELDPVMLTLTVGSTVGEAVDYLADSGPGRAVLETIDYPRRGEALTAVHQALEPHSTERGVQLEAAVLIIQARR